MTNDLYALAWLIGCWASLWIDEQMAKMTPKIKRTCPKFGKMPASCSCKKGKK